MFDQLFSRSRTADTGVGSVHGDGSSDLPISNCISGELGGVGMSIGYCTSSSPSVPTIITIVTPAKTIYEDSLSNSLISVVPTRSEPEEEASSTQAPTRTFTASGFLAAIFGIGIALSFWTPKNLWVFMGGFGFRREKRRQKNKQPQRTVEVAEGVVVEGKVLTNGQKDKGKAIDNETEGESSSSASDERTGLLIGEPLTYSSGLDLGTPRDSGVDLTNGEEARAIRSEDLPIYPEPKKAPAPVPAPEPELTEEDMLRTIDEEEEADPSVNESWTFADHQLPPISNPPIEAPAPRVEAESPKVALQVEPAVEPAVEHAGGSCPYINRKNSSDLLSSSIVVVDHPVTNEDEPKQSSLNELAVSTEAESPILPIVGSVPEPKAVEKKVEEKRLEKEMEAPVKVEEKIEEVEAGPSVSWEVGVSNLEEAVGVETAKVEKVEAPKEIEVPKVEIPEVEAPKQVEILKKVEPPAIEAEIPARVVETPKAEEVEAPKVELVEAPVVEVEAPKPMEVEAPKIETPKVEAVVEEPKEVKSAPVSLPAPTAPQIELIPPTPAFNNEFAEEAQAFLKERAESEEEVVEPTLPKLNEENEPVIPVKSVSRSKTPEQVKPTSGSLTVDYKEKEDDDLSLVDHPISHSPDQISLNGDDKKEEEPVATEETHRPSSAKPPSTIGDDNKSTRSESTRRNSFRRMTGLGSHSRNASIDSTKREKSLRRSMTGILPGGKKMKRENSAPGSVASTSQVKLGELTPPPTPPETSQDVARPESRRSEREKSSISRAMSWSHAVNKLSPKDKRDQVAKKDSDPGADATNGAETTEPIKPSSASIISTKDRPTTSDGEKQSKIPRRTSWFSKKKSSSNLSVADVVKSASTANLDSAKDEVVASATEVAAPLDKGKGVARSPPVEAAKEAPIVEAPSPSAEEQKVDAETAAAAKEVVAAAEKTPKLKSRVTSMMAWRKRK